MGAGSVGVYRTHDAPGAAFRGLSVQALRDRQYHFFQHYGVFCIKIQKVVIRQRRSYETPFMDTLCGIRREPVNFPKKFICQSLLEPQYWPGVNNG